MGILAIAKANGYGHGIVRVSKEFQKLGAVGIGVADISEALVLRETDFRGEILCLGPSRADALSRAADVNLTVALHSGD